MVDLVEGSYIADSFGFWPFCLELVVETDCRVDCAIRYRLLLIFSVGLVGSLVSARATSYLLDFRYL
jgi:hypothetical protein